jgi:hypothetical protein
VGEGEIRAIRQAIVGFLREWFGRRFGSSPRNEDRQRDERREAMQMMEYLDDSHDLPVDEERIQPGRELLVESSPVLSKKEPVLSEEWRSLVGR